MRLIEHYLSIQGEGLRAGKLAYFVRFARCNLRCSWCDSAYTFGEGREVSFKMVAEDIRRSKADYVCLTGGEPLLHLKDCLRLIRLYPFLHFDIETGGSLDIRPVRLKNCSVIMDWKLKHSGMNHKMKLSNLIYLRKNFDLLKFVTDGSDTEKKEILKIARKTKKSGFPISLQPVYPLSGNARFNPRELAEWMISLKDPRFQFNLQIHKHIWGEKSTGV